MKNISPLEIKNKKFNKSFMGFDPNQVKDYLNNLSREWELIINKINYLEQELNNSKNETKKLKETENTLLKTLKRAEETGDEIIKKANKRSDEIINDATNKSKKLLSEADDELQIIKERLNNIKDLKKDLLLEVKKLISDVTKSINSLSDDSNNENSFDLDIDSNSIDENEIVQKKKEVNKQIEEEVVNEEIEEEVVNEEIEEEVVELVSLQDEKNTKKNDVGEQKSFFDTINEK